LRCGRSHDGPACQKPGGQWEDEVDHIDVEGLRIAYRQAGEGPALVLLHGAFSDSRAWRPQLDELSDAFRVVAWDAPGCGGSSDPPEPFGMAGYADCLAGFVDAVGLGRPHVLGLSFGGGLALALYERHPELPRTLVLASAYAGWAGSLPPEEVEQRRQRALREIDLPPEQWVRGYLPGLFTEAAKPEVIDQALAMMSETRPAGMRAMLSCVRRRGSAARAAAHRRPDAAAVRRRRPACSAVRGRGSARQDPCLKARGTARRWP